jgi:hypothetical protein
LLVAQRADVCSFADAAIELDADFRGCGQKRLLIYRYIPEERTEDPGARTDEEGPADVPR